jgi:hypothetical protein
MPIKPKYYLLASIVVIGIAGGGVYVASQSGNNAPTGVHMVAGKADLLTQYKPKYQLAYQPLKQSDGYHAYYKNGLDLTALTNKVIDIEIDKAGFETDADKKAVRKLIDADDIGNFTTDNASTLYNSVFGKTATQDNMSHVENLRRMLSSTKVAVSKEQDLNNGDKVTLLVEAPDEAGIKTGKRVITVSGLKTPKSIDVKDFTAHLIAPASEADESHGDYAILDKTYAKKLGLKTGGENSRFRGIMAGAFEGKVNYYIDGWSLSGDVYDLSDGAVALHVPGDAEKYFYKYSVQQVED